jgi:hypothetical protein
MQAKKPYCEMNKFKLTETFLTINRSPLSVAMRNKQTNQQTCLLVNTEISGGINTKRKEEKI